MSDEKALIPIEERQIDFYGDDIIAVLVDVNEEERVYIPIRPICTYLGLSWSGQSERIKRDLVLSQETQGVRITRTPGSDATRAGGSQTMLCLPLDFLNGWLFGINAARVKEELRDKVVRYQRECYRILAEAFQLRTSMTPAQSAAITVLEQLRDYGLALAQLATDQLEMEKKMAHQGERLDKAALVVGDIVKRLKYVERRVSPGAIITEEQAMVLSQTVKALSDLLTEQDPQGKNHYQGVMGELYRRFGITSYKVIEICRPIWQNPAHYASQAHRRDILHQPCLSRHLGSSGSWTCLNRYQIPLPSDEGDLTRPGCSAGKASKMRHDILHKAILSR